MAMPHFSATLSSLASSFPSSSLSLPPFPRSHTLPATPGVSSSADQQEGEGVDAGQQPQQQAGGCAGCGKAEKRSDCDGTGRIQGGMGSIPGFTWWPIKAYRPCPDFIAAGGRYKRQGQSLNEVAFGQKGMDDDLDISQRLKGR